MVLVTGNPAALSRSRALDSSRDAISASTRVRRNSSGDQRWVLAVTSSSGARRRIAPSRSRRRPPSRSPASAGVAGAVMWLRRSRSPTGVGWRRRAAGSRALRRVTPGGRRRCRRRGSSGRRSPGDGRRSTARSRAAIRASRPWAASRAASSSRSPPELAVPGRGGGLDERDGWRVPGRRTRSRRSSWGGPLGPGWRAAGRRSGRR